MRLDENDDLALNIRKETGMNDENLLLNKLSCDLLMKNGKKFIKLPIPTVMIQIDSPFEVMVRGSLVKGAAGAWLALDAEGEYYIIDDSLKAASYRPHRVRTKKVK